MKRFVSVNAAFGRDGTMVPIRIIWDNGAEYPVSDVIAVKYFPTAKTADGGIKFTCIVLGKIRELYFEGHRWYIDPKI